MAFAQMCLKQIAPEKDVSVGMTVGGSSCYQAEWERATGVAVAVHMWGALKLLLPGCTCGCHGKAAMASRLKRAVAFFTHLQSPGVVVSVSTSRAT